MSQRSLWDHIEEGATRQEHEDRAVKEEARKRTFKKLRASGQWLTLLRVAHTIPQPFTLNDISVAVWRNCPESFSMKGHGYPDNHKVHSILYGQRGLIAKGMIRRVEEGLFRVPEGGNPDQLLLTAEAEAAS